MEIIWANDIVLVPTIVAVCPNCAGPLITSSFELEETVPGVSLYIPIWGIAICLFDKNHGSQDDERWYRVDDAISAWLKRGFILVDVDPATVRSEAEGDQPSAGIGT
jgi:hypothetical protein